MSACEPRETRDTKIPTPCSFPVEHTMYMYVHTWKLLQLYGLIKDPTYAKVTTVHYFEVKGKINCIN